MSTLSRTHHNKTTTVAFEPQTQKTASHPSFVAALTIAGSDSGGGAGIQADLKAFAASGVYGTAAITAVTAQNTLGVNLVTLSSAKMLTAQIQAVLSDLPVRAAKTGMLGSVQLCHAVVRVLAEARELKLVVDPVLIATTGARLSSDQSISAIRRNLLPRASVLTPNLPEAEALLGMPVNTRHDMFEAAQKLLALGASAVLLKGGHLSGTRCHDLYIDRQQHFWASSPRLPVRGHGTGCTLSALITAQLALGRDTAEACHVAIFQLRKYLRNAHAAGAGALSTPDPFWPRYLAAKVSVARDGR